MLSDHARYLREKAKQFRDIAGRYRTRLSPQLLSLADEFDAKAAEIETATDDGATPSCP